jgi:hypothetical protein
LQEKPHQLLTSSKLDFFRSIGHKSGAFYVTSPSSKLSSSAASEVSFSDAEHSRPHYQVKNKPTPPKKPDRLHLYRATSALSVDATLSDGGATMTTRDRKRKHVRPSFPPEYHPLQQQHLAMHNHIHGQHHHHQGFSVSAAASDVGVPSTPSPVVEKSSSSRGGKSLIAQKWPSLQGFRLRQSSNSSNRSSPVPFVPEATQKARVEWC